MDNESTQSERDPPRYRGVDETDIATVAAAAQLTSQNYRRWNVDTGEADDFEWTLYELQCPAMMSCRKFIRGEIERRRFVDAGDDAESAEGCQ